MGATMKMIGLIGGMSWESSAAYYRLLNERVRQSLGATASARCLLWSFDFAEIEALQHAGDWSELARRMADAAQRLEGAGADILLLCTNTMHKVAEDVEGAVSVPLLHIADPTAERIAASGMRRVGLLGTAFTMEEPFYKDHLRARRGLDVIVPEAIDRKKVHEVIYQELIAGIISPASRLAFRDVIARLVAAGAEGIILGCTEIMLLIGEADSAVPLFDTTTLHAHAAADFAMAHS
jgi:aspartate racemase